MSGGPIPGQGIAPIDAKVLTSSKVSKAADIAQKLEQAAEVSGRSTLWVVFDILRRRFGRQKLSVFEYFDFGIYRPDLTNADRDAFVTDVEISRLNAALRPEEKQSLSGLVGSKILTEMVLRGVGMPSSRTVAIARASRARLPIPVLVGADAIEAFLRENGQLPLFGKPNASSLGVGAASLMALEGDEVVFGDSSRTGVARLSHEIARDYPNGFLFQKILAPHPDLAALAGPVVGTLRVLSLWLKQGPTPLFIMLKMPGPGAMVDGSLSGTNAAAIVDPETGRIVRAQLLGRPIGEDLIHSHVTGAVLPGAELPDFAEAVKLGLDAHRLFPLHGVLGSDIILTDKGPVVNEVNMNPLASLVQSARGRGLYDEANKAKYREAFSLLGVKLPIRGVRL